MYPADLPTIRNALPNGTVLPAGDRAASDTCSIHLSETPAPVPFQNQSEFPRVRGYILQSFIGSGGMGVVYKARHIDLQRTVALKMLNESSASDREAHERFQAEAEAVARVQHPNIIQVFEIGSVQAVAGEPKPRPFLSLEFMDGGSLSRFTESPQAPAFAARMVEKLARGAHAAHILGVVHRDLKPANVLLNQAGEPKIADFGVAKLSGEQSRLLTQAGMTVGTPEYMAPEQAAGEDSGPAADIYSLGVILYQLLTARLPFHGANPVDTMYLVRNEDPVSPRRFQPNLPRDLETICLKCLEKKPARRYGSAADLAEDLARWMEGRTIMARPVSRLERTRLWVKRNPTVAALSVAVVLVTLIGIAGVVWKAWDATQEAKRAQRGEAQARWEQYRSNIIAVSSAIQLENALTARRLLESVPEEHRSTWEWGYFQNQLDSSRETFQTADNVFIVAATPGADRLITVADSLHASVWDPFSGKKHLVTYPNLADLGRSTIHPRGENVALILLDNSRRRVALHYLQAQKPNLVLPFEKDVLNVRFNHDGSLFAAACDDGTLQIFENATGRKIKEFKTHSVEQGYSSFSGDGRHIATCGTENDFARIWDYETGKLLHEYKLPPVKTESVCLNTTGDRFVTSCWAPSSKFWLWDVSKPEPIAELTGHSNQVRWYGFNSDSSLFATACLDQRARVWDARTGQKLPELEGHTGWVEFAAFNPEGDRLATASHDCTVRIWNPRDGVCVAVLRGHRAPVLHVTYSKDGKTIISTSRDGVVKLWSSVEAERGNALRGHSRYVYSVACHPDNERIASSAWDGTIRIWSVRTGKQIKLIDYGGDAIIPSIAFHPDGKLLAAVCRDGTVRLWDVDTAQEVHRFLAPTGHWRDTRLAFSPDGSLLATGDTKHNVRIWDVNTRTEYATLKSHTDIIRDLAFSPDGKYLATAGADADYGIRVWNVKDRELAHVLKPTVKGQDGHSDLLYALAYSPNGKWLASGSVDGTARLWSTENWGESHELKHATNVHGLAFTPDSTRLASACSDRSIRLWYVEDRQELAELRAHADYVHSVAFTPDGSRLISGSGDQTVRIWHSPKQTK